MQSWIKSILKRWIIALVQLKGGALVLYLRRRDWHYISALLRTFDIRSLSYVCITPRPNHVGILINLINKEARAAADPMRVDGVIVLFARIVNVNPILTVHLDIQHCLRLFDRSPTVKKLNIADWKDSNSIYIARHRRSRWESSRTIFSHVFKRKAQILNFERGGPCQVLALRFASIKYTAIRFCLNTSKPFMMVFDWFIAATGAGRRTTGAGTEGAGKPGGGKRAGGRAPTKPLKNKSKKRSVKILGAARSSISPKSSVRMNWKRSSLPSRALLYTNAINPIPIPKSRYDDI